MSNVVEKAYEEMLKAQRQVIENLTMVIKAQSETIEQFISTNKRKGE